jgi:hypothetical protein
MRDIRNDLRERLAELDGRKGDELATYADECRRLQQAHMEKMGAIDRERDALKKLLEIEDRRALAMPALKFGSAPKVPLADFLIAKVQTSAPIEKDALREAADEAGYTDHRAFHTTLLNITRKGRLSQDSSGRYLPATTEALGIFGRLMSRDPAEHEECEMRRLM